jgi:hypothetical protein
VGLSLRSLPSVGKQVIDASTFNRPVQIESRAKRAFRRSYRHVSFGIAAAFPRDAFARQLVRGLGGRSRLEASRQRKSQSWLQRTLRLALIAAEKHEQRASQDKVRRRLMQLRAIDSVNTVALSRCRATEGGRNCPPIGTPCGLCYVTQLSDRLAPEVGDAAHLALVFASTSALHYMVVIAVIAE